MNSSDQPFPGAPRVRIDSEDNFNYSDTSFTVVTPSPSRTGGHRAPSLPQLQIPTLAHETPPSPTYLAPSVSAPNTSKALSESRKLLAHLLGQLRTRPLPPPVFDAFKDIDGNLNDTKLADVVQTVRAAVKLKGGKRDERAQPPAPQRDDSDEEDDTEKTFTTDATFSLMTQLRDVLLISRLQNWQIFHDSSASSERIKDRRGSGGRSPFRLRRNSLQVGGGRRSRSPSPARGGSVQAPELLSQCISVLASVVSEDCRFKISSPRPSRPPNALQAVVLDVALFLIHTQRHDPKIISQIAFALIPAFSTFHIEMQPRLLAFFEEGIIRDVLEDLSRTQGAGQIEASSAGDNIDAVKPPMVSIQIEGPKDDTSVASQAAPLWTPWSSLIPSSTNNLQSTKAPLQSLAVYYLASLVPPLLVAILESIDLASPSPPTLHRLCRLISLVATFKPDAYLDVLEVVAYHTAKARRSALCLLSTFWPNALGHVFISKPLPIFSYVDSLQRTGGTGPMLRRRMEHPYAHQFVPWRFAPASKPALFESSLQQACRSCSVAITGFGLLCPFCMCAVHFDCYDYPEGSFLSQYALASDPNTQKVAVHRFCHILSPRRDWDPQVVKKERHAFKAVNIFTLSLCFICRKPLWGCVIQGLKCSSCQQFVHSSCLSTASSADLPRCRSTRIDSSHMTIDSDTLRLSFLDHYSDILAIKDLHMRTYEEISVISAILWTQLQLLNNGVALGSVVIQAKKSTFPSPKQKDPDKWELHYVLDSCEHYLASGRLPVSVATDEYLQESRRSAAEHSLLFDWSHLAYISTAVKSSFEESKPIFASRDLLNVNPPQVPTDDTDEARRHHFELVSLSHMRDVLGYELHLFSDATAGYLLTHLHHLGFFDRQDLHPVLFEGTFSNEDIACIFPIPQGLDLSTDVETLFAAIEGCLSDLDLSVNEQGLLLLVRRLWPNGMASEYALRRLARNLISWIFAEDANLAAILRDYLAQGRQLPGVRTTFESLPWPSANSTRPTPTSTVNNGGDYVASRRALLNQYVSRWLLAFHDQEFKVYANVLYEICTDLAGDASVHDELFLGKWETNAEKKRNTAYADRILRYIIKLCQTTVTFSVFDDLFLMWLETVSAMNLYHEPMPSLYRLFNRESEGGNRSSVLIDASLGPADAVGMAVVDSWRLVMRVASTDKDGWSRSLRWLCVFARSGVDIPVPTYLAFASLASKFEASLPECNLLVEAALSSTWLKSMGRQELQTMFSALHSRLTPQILDSLRSKVHHSEALSFIRRSLATCLLLYGCERNSLLEVQMVTESEVNDLPSRRKINIRASMVSDPIIIDLGLMNALERYVAVNVEVVTCFVAKFLNKFVTDASLLEHYEVDNFILRNGRVLCACAWEFYDIQRPELSSVRSSFLLRILVVDSQPFQILMEDIFQPGGNWERRFLAVTRLFRIVLDVTSPFFHVEGRQWRSSVIEVFYRYFGAIWMDEREEIRLAVDTWSQTLLPAHFEAISLCWSESLANAPIPERVHLVSFLVQLHPHFPNWKVLSWDAIIETLLEDDYLQKHGGNDDGAAAAHLSMYGLSSKDDQALQALADPDMATLRVSIILLSLQMIEDKVNIDIFSLLKIKFHLAQVIGFSDVSIVPASSGHAFHVRLGDLGNMSEQGIPCVNQLPVVLDAGHPFDLAPSAVGGPYVEDDTPSSLLVGAIFVDVSLAILSLTTNLLSLPILTIKSMLESLMIVIYKHNLDAKPLKHLHSSLMRAVRRAMELVSQDISYEIRQLALSAVQAYVKRWPTIRNVFVFDAIENAAKLIISLGHDGEDILVAQARSFLEASLTGFSVNGIFGILCKRPLNRDFFTVIKHLTDIHAKSMASSPESLRDALLRDAISNIADNESKVCQFMLNNINTYIEVVHHQGYTADLMQAVGFAWTNVARRLSDWPISFDPSSILLISSSILQHNKAHSRELLSSVETVLRVALTRFNVSTECLSRMLHVTSTLFRKSQSRPGTAGQTQTNTIAMVVFEILAEGLRREGRVTPSTISSMIEAIMSEDNGYVPPALTSPGAFLSLAEDGFFFLQNHTWLEVQSENDFAASVAVAKMILQASQQKPDIILKQFTDTSERYVRQSLTVRTWNILAFAALCNPSDSWTSILFSHFSTFSFTYNVSLRGLGNSGTSPPETAQADINYAFNAIKLWLLLALKKFRLKGISHNKERDPAVLEDNEDAATRMVWNELWPSFALLVDSFEPEARTSLAALTWSSVADLILFVRQSRSDIAHEASSHIALLSRLQRWSAEDTATNNRLNRALRSMSEPPADVPMEVLISQIGKSIIAEEKLVVLEAKSREAPAGKTVQDRTRRDVRLPT